MLPSTRDGEIEGAKRLTVIELLRAVDWQRLGKSRLGSSQPLEEPLFFRNWGSGEGLRDTSPSWSSYLRSTPGPVLSALPGEEGKIEEGGHAHPLTPYKSSLTQ